MKRNKRKPRKKTGYWRQNCYSWSYLEARQRSSPVRLHYFGLFPEIWITEDTTWQPPSPLYGSTACESIRQFELWKRQGSQKRETLKIREQRQTYYSPAKGKAENSTVTRANPMCVPLDTQPIVLCPGNRQKGKEIPQMKGKQSL